MDGVNCLKATEPLRGGSLLFTTKRALLKEQLFNKYFASQCTALQKKLLKLYGPFLGIGFN